ncbi:hypothetical protein G6L97_27260 (plasmid) [Agrobacterium tumefaciens]|uniref:hypothetical protein n=1 Tax=Agrobacterium tumefaciens TaxID=358 RepID=UPI00157234CF|nr:hypothetical protein [Agrobacterium tumefaciens]NSZ87768.1 hypothetical protein [Agrobacterium tumefaciens]WCA73173.1 hypothetical protein G6L97_27260 [Agrobacterium tumefaciens]
MGDRTVTDRMKRQRELRAAEGWQKVTVWVPTVVDAEDVKKLAAERRARAEALAGLSEEVPKVNVDAAERIARAIAEHGSKAYNTPSGAVLELMKELAKEDDLESLASAFVIIARAKPTNAKFITARVPAMISEFLIRHRGIDGGAMGKWGMSNPGWADEIKAAIREPERFPQVVDALAQTIKRSQTVQ